MQAVSYDSQAGIHLKACSPRAKLLFRVGIVPYLNRHRRTPYRNHFDFFERRPELMLYRFTPREVSDCVEELRAHQVIEFVHKINPRCITLWDGRRRR